jgi:PAS domain S-box-containing protein
MNYLYSILHAIAALLFIILASGIFIKDPRSRLNQICAGLLCCFFIWSAAYAVLQSPAISSGAVMFYENIASTGWIFFGFFFIWFSWLYSHRHPFCGFKVLTVVLFLVPCLLLVMQWTCGALIDRHIQQPYGWLGLWNASIWPYFFYGYYTSAIGIGIFWIGQYSRKSTSLPIKRHAWILIGSSIIPFCLGSISNVLFPRAGFYVLPSIADIIISLWGFGLAYAVLKYRLPGITPFIAADRIIESMKDLLFLLDPKGRIISINQAVCEKLEFPNEELIGKPFESVLAGSIKDKTILIGSLKTVSLKEFETEMVMQSGHVLPVSLTTSTITGIGIVCVAHDITLQLKIELHHAQKMEAIGRLAGGIAHDFNNLLGGIVGYADLLRMKLSAPLPSESATAQKIVDIAQQASRLTSQLLAFSRKGKYQVQAIDLHECIDDTARILERTISKKIAIVKKLEAASTVVMGDRSQLQNVFLNIGVNARDAMPDGGTLTFESSTFDLDAAVARSYPYKVDPGTFIKIAVTDTGIGMDTETCARAFEPFFSTKGQGKGTGLGLASVYGTVKNHSGFIELWSEKGKGTTIIVCLPITAASIPSRNETGAIEGKGGVPGRILVVDDEKIVREMASDALSMLGYAVSSCADGSEALAKYRERSGEYDLVLLDLTMPGMDGRECLKALRSINAHLKVIITSGHALDNEISAILTDTTIAFLQKPFDLRALSSAVRRALGV